LKNTLNKQNRNRLLFNNFHYSLLNLPQTGGVVYTAPPVFVVLEWERKEFFIAIHKYLCYTDKRIKILRGAL
jgi:hypothetical protein